MNMRILALSALTAIACARVESKPAQSPAKGDNVTASTDTSRTTVTSPFGEPGAPMRTTPVGPTTTSKGPEAEAPRTGLATGGGPFAASNNPGTPDATKTPDNTRVNERDRRGSTLTPLDQGNSASETTISATIRRALMGDKNLSFTAKNVKVITVGTKVTLRGPVKSEQEKATIETLARQTANVSEVDNQLEVKN